MDLQSALKSIENARSEIISDMCDMIRIPAIGPMNGGKGECERADKIMTFLDGFDSVERVDVMDDYDPTVIRPNIVARKNGPAKGTVWIVAHMDTVLPGNLEDWNTPPYEPTVDGDKIYGLGTEDNGQAVIASIVAARRIPKGELKGKSLGLAIVADEETTSLLGIAKLIERGLFEKDDFILVPDWGSPNGSMIEVAEKHLLWFKASITGKQTHGSTPQKGINAFRVSTEFLADLMKRLAERYPKENSMFRPPVSTFEPTKSIATVGNVNTIPGYDEFYMDCRILPGYDPDEIFSFVRSVAEEHEKRTKAKIDINLEQRTFSGKPSSADTEDFKKFKEAVKSVVGEDVSVVGVGGGTCANFFRLEGLNAYVWESGGGTLHQPNEHVLISNIITDAKVYATTFYKLCM